jgi:hypothetical protein
VRGQGAKVLLTGRRLDLRRCYRSNGATNLVIRVTENLVVAERFHRAAGEVDSVNVVCDSAVGDAASAGDDGQAVGVICHQNTLELNAKSASASSYASSGVIHERGIFHDEFTVGRSSDAVAL